MPPDSSKSSENRRKLDDELVALAKTLAPFIGESLLFDIDHEQWSLDDLGPESRKHIHKIDDITTSKDPSLLLSVMLDRWEPNFKHRLAQNEITFRLVDKVRRIRNDHAHYKIDNYDDHYVTDSINAIRTLRDNIPTETSSYTRESPSHDQSTAQQKARTSADPKSSNIHSSFFSKGLEFSSFCEGLGSITIPTLRAIMLIYDFIILSIKFILFFCISFFVFTIILAVIEVIVNFGFDYNIIIVNDISVLIVISMSICAAVGLATKRLNISPMFFILYPMFFVLYPMFFVLYQRSLIGTRKGLPKSEKSEPLS